jgi:predicted transposase/invertase (TIGR01784 family)
VNYRNTEEVIKGLEFVLVELPKFRAEQWADRREAALWLRFLNEVEEHKSTVPEELKEDACIRQALDMCEEGAFSETELAAYEKYWDIIRTEGGIIATSRAEGEAKGRAESLTGIVRNCGRNGFSMEQIQAITGLDREKIAEILRTNEEQSTH